MLEPLTVEAGARDGLDVTICVIEVPVREDRFEGVSNHEHTPAIEMIHVTSAPGNVIILQRTGQQHVLD